MFGNKKLNKIFRFAIFKLKTYFFNLTIIPFYVPALLVLIIIFLLKRKYKIRIFRLTPRLGFDLPYFDNYFNYEYGKKNHLDLFFYYFVPSNSFFKTILKKRLIFINRHLGESIVNLNYLFSKIFSYNFEYLCPDLFFRNRDLDNFLDTKDANFKLTSEENKKGKLILNSMGVPENKKFICLNVRDSQFLKKKLFKLDFDYHSYRNANIDDFLLCCDELTKLGYYVIRMGVVTEKKIETKNNKIIDYSNSKYRSDFMDFYLGINCEFCITTGSGFDSIPFTFRRPLLYVNISPLGILNASSKRYLFIPKHHYCKKEKRKLSLKEIFNREVAFSFTTNDFTNKNISLLDNSPREILDASLDMINLIKNNYLLDSNQTQNLKKFKDILVKNMSYSQYNELHGEIKSTFCKSFLENNINFLN